MGSTPSAEQKRFIYQQIDTLCTFMEFWEETNTVTDPVQKQNSLHHLYFLSRFIDHRYRKELQKKYTPILMFNYIAKLFNKWESSAQIKNPMTSDRMNEALQILRRWNGYTFDMHTYFMGFQTLES